MLHSCVKVHKAIKLPLEWPVGLAQDWYIRSGSTSPKGRGGFEGFSGPMV